MIFSLCGYGLPDLQTKMNWIQALLFAIWSTTFVSLKDPTFGKGVRHLKGKTEKVSIGVGASTFPPKNTFPVPIPIQHLKKDPQCAFNLITLRLLRPRGWISTSASPKNQQFTVATLCVTVKCECQTRFSDNT